MKKILILLILTLFAIYFVATKCDSCSLDYVTINNQKVAISIADNEEERKNGLSGREEQSMLFVFETPGVYGIWMKDMLFPIDITWIDENMAVVHIERDVLPDTYPEVFTPEKEALYVLETPIDLITVRIGDIVDL